MTKQEAKRRSHGDYSPSEDSGEPTPTGRVPLLARSFILRFAIAALCLLTVYCFPYAELGLSERVFNAYLDGYARVVGAILHLSESDIAVSLNQIHGRFSLEIAKSCDAMECNILFVSAMVAFPGSWQRKAIVAVLGMAVLIGFNLTRIVSLYYAGVFWPRSFHFLHAAGWPLAMIVLTGLVFLYCTRFVQEAGREPRLEVSVHGVDPT
jgi:exosortase/archaeosortase family protein